jgi:hypothetical protein
MVASARSLLERKDSKYAIMSADREHSTERVATRIFFADILRYLSIHIVSSRNYITRKSSLYYMIKL